MNNHKPHAEGFFYQPKTIQWILRIFYALCVLSVIADFVVHRHIIIDVERVPAFYAVYGFISCVILVVIAAKIRQWVIRDESYYDESAEASKNAKYDSVNEGDK